MQGLEKLFKELEGRVAHLEKQMGFMIGHMNHLSNLTQCHEWQIHKLEDDGRSGAVDKESLT